MDYLKTYLTDIIFKHYIDFKGRERRKVFWLFTLNIFIINVILGLILGLLFSEETAMVIATMISLALFLPSLGLNVRRLHDINFSGWWVLLGLIPILGAIALIVLACLPSVEPNKYGGEVDMNSSVVQ